MRSGEAGSARGASDRQDLVQGSLEGILPEEPVTAEKETSDASGSVMSQTAKSPAKKRTSPPRRSDGATDADALRGSLDALEENITLLLARHESLVADAIDRERRRKQGAPDPVAQEKRVRELEADKEKLERHSRFLEDRIRGLLSRVRYVIES